MEEKDLNEEVETSEEEKKDENTVDASAEETEILEPEETEEETTDQSELEKVQTELDETTDRYLRLQAEFANIRKRNKREREDLLRHRSQSLSTEILPALDNLERALSIEVDTEAGDNLKKGIEMVYDSILLAFSKEGIEVVDPVGEPFDPNYHEAYTQVPAKENQGSNEVDQVFEKGYKLHDRVLRAAKVSVTL